MSDPWQGIEGTIEGAFPGGAVEVQDPPDEVATGDGETTNIKLDDWLPSYSGDSGTNSSGGSGGESSDSDPDPNQPVTNSNDVVTKEMNDDDPNQPTNCLRFGPGDPFYQYCDQEHRPDPAVTTFGPVRLSAYGTRVWRHGRVAEVKYRVTLKNVGDEPLLAGYVRRDLDGNEESRNWGGKQLDPGESIDWDESRSGGNNEGNANVRFAPILSPEGDGGPAVELRGLDLSAPPPGEDDSGADGSGGSDNSDSGDSGGGGASPGPGSIDSINGLIDQLPGAGSVWGSAGVPSGESSESPPPDESGESDGVGPAVVLGAAAALAALLGGR